VKSLETTVNHILRKLRTFSSGEPGRPAEVHAHPDVADLLRERAAHLERTGTPLPVTLTVVPEVGRHRETFDVRGP
jgi:hypothetical protein